MGKILILLFTLCSCAGPVSPFGSSLSLNKEKLVLSKPLEIAKRGLASIEEDSSVISFYPQKQIFHKGQSLHITIKDTAQTPKRDDIYFYYNGEDITSQVKSIAVVSKKNKELTFTIKKLRLLPSYDNRIHVHYKKKDESLGVIKEYEYPSCSFTRFEQVENLDVFKSKRKLASIISKISIEREMNPSLVNALVAQESSYNIKAVSSAKAIGLTQITGLAEKDILAQEYEWPRYPRINRYPKRMIKGLIKKGVINKENEWRLDPSLSIHGGISYLKHLHHYWSKNFNLIERSYKKEEQTDAYTDLILASYNSGAARVKYALKKKRRKWKNYRKLKEAKKYVHNIRSYCYSFAGGLK